MSFGCVWRSCAVKGADNNASVAKRKRMQYLAIVWIVYICVVFAVALLNFFESIRSTIPFIVRLGVYAHGSIIVCSIIVCFWHPFFLLAVLLLTGGMWVLAAQPIGRASFAVSIIALILAIPCIFHSIRAEKWMPSSGRGIYRKGKIHGRR